ncbi:MAG: hypothetical protein ABI895_32420 [Deltaproteobacteria bacterium]
MSLVLNELLSISFISYAGNDLSQRQLVTVAADHRDRAELKALGTMHRAHDDPVRRWLCLGFEPLAWNVRGTKRWCDALGDELGRASEHGDLMQRHAFVSASA